VKRTSLANQVQIALVRKTEIGEAFADLLDQNLRSRGTGGEADAGDAFEPLGINIVCGIDELGLAIKALGEFHKPVGVRAVLRTDDENELHVLGELARPLPWRFWVA